MPTDRTAATLYRDRSPGTVGWHVAGAIERLDAVIESMTAANGREPNALTDVRDNWLRPILDGPLSHGQ